VAAAKKKNKNVLSGLSTKTGRAAVIGLIITAIAVPFLAVPTVAASTAISDFDDLPEYFEIGSQPQQNSIIAYSGKREIKIATVYSQNRQEITWDDVSDTLKNAVLAAEDRRFYEHGGIDVQGIIRALVTDVTTGSKEGASTLTQQTVKNICIAEAFKDYPDADEINNPEEYEKYIAAVDNCNEAEIDRKVREMKYAIQLEKTYSKDEILLAYLNIANYGGTVYGIQSAAERYYNVDAKDLTLVQAASLIAIVQQPGARRLDDEANYAANTERRDRILKNMAQYGFITAAERDDAMAVVEGSDNDTLDIKETSNGCSAANTYAKQFCDYVVKNVKNYAALGDTEAERLNNWRIGGYTLYTTLDIRLQKVAQKSLALHAPANETLLKLGASAVTVEAGTGRVLTMAQNKTFDDTGNGNKKTSTAVNFNTDKEYGGSSGFQVGSTYKVFTLINWLEDGHGLQERVQANARTVAQADFEDTCNGPWYGPYQFRNDSGSASNVTVQQATASSINGAFITMALQLDLCKTRKIAQALGVHLAAGKADGSDLQTIPSSVLGINTIAPLSVAAAYAGIANNGVYCAPIVIDKIVDASGQDIGGQAQECDRAIPEDVAVATQYALQSAMAGYAANPRDGTELIGKTGTTNDSIQTWVTGASTRAATTVWYGNIIGTYPIRSYGGGGTFGGNQRHLIMNAILTKMDELYPGGTFDEPSTALLVGKTAIVPNVVGQSESSARSEIANTSFYTSSTVQTVASDLPKGQVAKQVPGGGSRASEGAAVTLYISDGSQSSVPDVIGSSADSAISSLESSGFTNIGQYCVETGPIDPATGLNADGETPDPDGTVLEQAPSSGTVKSQDGRIRIGVAAVTC